LVLALDIDKNMKDLELRGYKAFILERSDLIMRIHVIHEVENIGDVVHDVLGTYLGSESSL